METITISKKEYEKLKKQSQVDEVLVAKIKRVEKMSKQEIRDSDLYKQLVQSIQDLKTGRMTRTR